MKKILILIAYLNYNIILRQLISRLKLKKEFDYLAPRVGFEPTTDRLTADCSTTELPRIIFEYTINSVSSQPN